MTEQTNGLRFDVYERVHLPDGVAAIDELEEIELVPRIQVIEQGEHAILKGQLLLNGVYRSQAEYAEPQTLEHWIPVEITLPMNRVSRLEDISVEIDNFDVDLLSSRTLNVTGVLSLRGILVEPLSESAEPWKEEEESFTVVHRREQPDVVPYAAGEYGEEAEAESFGRSGSYESGQADVEWSAYSSEPAAEPVQDAARDPEPEAAIPEGREQEPEQELVEVPAQEPVYEARIPEEASVPESAPETESLPQADAYDAVQADVSEEQGAQDEAVEAAWSEPHNAAASGREEPAPAPEPEPEKQEMRISVGAKQENTDAGAEAPNVGLFTLLQTSRREQAARQAADESAKQNEQKQSEAGADEIEWSHLFLGKQSGQNEFRKIRMCIVQKEETLESIASRYSLNPREILLHNRLSDSTVSEGQLLYIP